MSGARSWRARALTIAIAAGFAALGAWTFTHLEVTTEITHFLPSSEDRELARIAQDMSGSDLNRTITLTIGARDTEAATGAARDLSRSLARRDDVAWVRHGPDDDLDQAFYELYHPRRLAFFTDDPSRHGLVSDEELRASAHALKQRLMSPTGTFVRQIAPGDPLLLFAAHLDRLREAQGGGLAVVDGSFVTDDGHAVVFLASRESPFAAEASARLLAGIDRAFERVRREHGGGLVLEQSSVHRFAARSQHAIREDVTRISTVSTVGIVLLFLVLFRSLRHVLLSTLPLVTGMIAGLAATQLVFGQVHGMALAFGSTLIGVGVDFATHYLNHHTLEPSAKGPFGSLRHILPGLALGAGTTLAGLAGLAWTSFPGIRELAVFSVAGVGVCLITTCVMLPPWMPTAPRPTRLHLWLSRALSSAMHKVRGSRVLRFVIPIVALLVCAAGLARMRWVDDPRALNALDPELVAEDERVRARVSRMDAGRFVIAWGEDEETALARNDEVHRTLLAARDAGELEAMRSLHGLLWSERAQRTSFDALARSPELERRLTAAFEAEGFVASAFEPFFEALRERPPVLRWRDLSASPLGPLVASFRFEGEGGRVGFVTLLRGGDVAALERRLAGMEGVRLFDQARFMGDAYGTFRVRTLQMVGAGLVLVFLMIFARYRRLAPALAAFAPAILASATSIAIVALAGVELNLMHLVALLLVLSMGEDYGVFIVEAYGAGDDMGSAMTSVLVACITTVLSFGLLAMSENPALRALGSITGLGVLLSFVLAPTGWLFLRAKA
jgi:predicted exporter